MMAWFWEAKEDDINEETKAHLSKLISELQGEKAHLSKLISELQGEKAHLLSSAEQLKAESSFSRTAVYNLQEEVFGIRDSLDALAAYLGLDISQDGENPRVVHAVPTEETTRNFEVAADEVLTKNEKEYVAKASRGLITAVMAVEERKRKRETFNQVRRG